MTHRSILHRCAFVAIAGSAPLLAQAFPDAPVTATGVVVTVVAEGLDDPRSLTLGPDGSLYVGEAGTTTGVFVPPPPPPPTEPPTRTRCSVYWPVGPRVGGFTGGVRRISATGAVRTLADDLPSVAANLLIGGDRSGVAAVGQRRGRVYALVSGGGCSNGHPSEPNGVYRIYPNGSWQPVADLSNYLRSHVDTKNPAAPDFEPDGTWYALVRAFGAFYTAEPNHGVMVRIDDDGSISLVADLMAKVAEKYGDGDKTYTSITVHRGAFYVGTLGRIDQGFAAGVYRVSRDGSDVTRVVDGLHGVVGVAFDSRDRMYVLETTAADVNPPLSDPTRGRLLRIEPDGSVTPVVTGLAFPTALIAGHDGAFYVSNCGYHCDDHSQPTFPSLHAGQVLRITVRDARAEDEEDH
jgi:hypothetical protein